MDNPNITMEEYIRLQEEKALSRGETFDWQTATYGKMEYCEDENDSFTNIETEYPAIVFDDTSDAALLCKSTVSPLNNNEIDFKISFDESDDEDYMVMFEENSFSYKIIYVDNLKTDSENENDKVNMPSSLITEPTIGYIGGLDFFLDFENKFPAIAYNDDLKSKSDPLIEPSIWHHYHLGIRGTRGSALVDIGASVRVMPFSTYSNLGLDFVILDIAEDDNVPLILGRPFLSTAHAKIDVFKRKFILRVGEEKLVFKSVKPATSIIRRVYMDLAVKKSTILYTLKKTRVRTRTSILTSRQHTFAQELKLENHPEQHIRGVPRGRHLRRCLAAHFGLVSDQGLRGLSVVTSELPLIDLHKLGRLNISDEDAPSVDEGAQADPAPVQEP
ncbi:hypothetical protein Tco_1019358 [Tanacetum coccineum]|uniref:Reverse transcriptase domain-containing protein n=1 Tax=Tanacetum coccineum TaxID=301880 RepID=A0ABQ5FY57_9ASTR